PDQIDTDFLKRFKELILEKVHEGFTFSIIAGGGKICRRYQAAAKEISPELMQVDLDWIGISVNCMHAEFLRILFGAAAAPTIVRDFSQPMPTSHPVLLVGAEKPGHSSDYDAVEMSKLFGTKRLVNLSNTDYVYDSDPKKNPDAKKIEKINWTDFRKLIPDHWDPGLSSPFDPVAAKEAEALGLEVAAINGTRLEEFSNYLDGKPFIGTAITK
ncbi:MAG: UMP kinase, partial [Patescibacteria group bacterium]|nr:UMP kinase [Patescibacteria group bacterium]